MMYELWSEIKVQDAHREASHYRMVKTARMEKKVIKWQAKGWKIQLAWPERLHSLLPFHR